MVLNQFLKGKSESCSIYELKTKKNIHLLEVSIDGKFKLLNKNLLKT